VDTDCEQSPYFLDEDGDGLGVGTPEHRCEPGEGFTASTDGDCYDESSSVGATGLWLLGTEDVDLTLLAEQLLDLDVTEPSTLVVCEGTWPLSVTATAELVVVGEGEDSVLTGLNEARVFDTSAPLTLLSVQLTEGFADGDGGAIWTDSDVVMFHSSVRDSEAIGSGGALFQAGAEATVTFTSSDFEDNFASDNGGAAVIEGHLESGGTSFRNNSATNGGALYLGIGTSLFDGAIFEGNTADRGGAMDLRPPHVTTLGNSTLTGNQASFGGAFATWETARLDCVDSVIEGNTGDTKGGAAWLLPSNDAVSLSSENCSWGEGDTDNVRDDIYNTQTAYAGTGGTWTCTGVSCEL
jgi:predicted outer membrane repeat protein